MLNVKLSYLDQWTRRRRELAHLYDTLLAGLPVTLPPSAEEGGHVYHRYTIRLGERDALRRYLADRGIETAIHYPVPIHRQPAASGEKLTLAPGGLPVTERQASEIVSLPLHPAVPETAVRHVAEQVMRFFDG